MNINTDNFKIAFQYALPKHATSKLVGFLARAKLGFVTTALIKTFIKVYKIDMSEAVYSDPKHYKTFNDFFTRALTSELRPIVEAPQALAHPVDGKVSQMGKIVDGALLQAKHHYYSAQELLGGEAFLSDTFNEGDFATIYLAPSDYHRIHMPIAGTLTDMIYVPGEAFSVNPLTAENVPNLFARNERVVCLFETEVGTMALVLVGATIVRSIETVWAGEITPPRGETISHRTYSTEGDEAIKLEKGEEMGRFKLGSTVVCLFEKNAIQFIEGLKAGSVTRMGTHFADSHSDLLSDKPELNDSQDS